MNLLLPEQSTISMTILDQLDTLCSSSSKMSKGEALLFLFLLVTTLTGELPEDQYAVIRLPGRQSCHIVEEEISEERISQV